MRWSMRGTGAHCRSAAAGTSGKHTVAGPGGHGEGLRRSRNAGELRAGAGGQVLVSACRGWYGNGGSVGRVIDQENLP